MNPIRFEASNVEFQKPKDWSDEKCHSIHGFLGRDIENLPVCITAWVPTPSELAQLAAGQPMFLIMCSAVMVPLMLTTKDPFEPDASTQTQSDED